MIGSCASLPALMDTVRELSPQGERVYLVGGAVRDLLMVKPCHDMDFVVEGDVRPLARRLANHLKGDFFMMDEVHQTARVLLADDQGNKQVCDFSTLRADDLTGDLTARDFTVNAIAIDVHAPSRLIDPLGGAGDILAKKLRACAPTAFSDDPLRILRGVRLSLTLNFSIAPETVKQMRQTVPDLQRISAERIRDELFRMLDCPQPATAMRVLDQLGVLQVVLPETTALKGVTQSAPHVWDVWEHTLAVLAEFQRLFSALVEDYREEAACNLWLGMAVMQLGRYRKNFDAHFQKPFNPLRSRRALLCLAALYHDIGKPVSRSEHADGRIHFYQHENLGVTILDKRARALALSQAEVEFLAQIVRQHLHIHFLAGEKNEASRRSIYRFFRAAGENGVDLVLLSLADRLATDGFNLSPQAWERQLAVCRQLLEAWWEAPDPGFKPTRLITGHDLQSQFGVAPGPTIGECLEAVQEAQAVGEVLDREQALAFARQWLEQKQVTKASGSL